MGCESCKQVRQDGNNLDIPECGQNEAGEKIESRLESQATGGMSDPPPPRAVVANAEGAAEIRGSSQEDKQAAMGRTCSSGPDQKETMEFLVKVPLFRRLPEDHHAKLAEGFEKVTFEQGDTVIKQGDNGSDLFIISIGEVSVKVNGSKVATLASGDYVGENALLRNEPRNATIIADTPLTCLRMTRDTFQELGLVSKLQFANRRAVGGGEQRKLVTKNSDAKNAVERELMVSALKANKNLLTMVTLDNKNCNAMVDIAWKESITEGTELIQQGNLDADYFYIVQQGSFEVVVTKQGKNDEEVRERVGVVPKGGSFGELALLYFAARAATVKALEPSVVWVMDRNNFKKILVSNSDQSRGYIKYLDKVEIFASLKDDEKATIAKALLDMKFNMGESILTQGEKGESFYILIEGEVEVIKDGKQVAKLIGSSAKAEIFGERAILNNEPRAATIKVFTESCKTLCMDKTSFEMLLGPLAALKKRGKDGGASKVGKAKEAKTPKAVAGEGGHIQRKHLNKLGLLGCGGFGAVVLVEHVKTKETYAMKALSKGYVVKCGMQQAVMSEKNIQYSCNSPFIVKLYDTYNGTKTLYFLLELALGGELYATYNKKGFHGSEKCAKFYVAGTVFSFDHLHSLKIIYRDLKPENLLLNEEGKIKLTDMGLAKVVVGKTFTTCGTPDYFAPEVIKSTGHTHAVDWWALGILVFELMAGQPPFQANTPMQTYQKIQDGIKKAIFPASVSGDCAALVKALCEKDPVERLAMRKGGSQNLRNHKWYKGFDWEKMEKGTLVAPYLPPVKDKSDASNFSARKEDMPPSMDYNDDGSSWDADFATST